MAKTHTSLPFAPRAGRGLSKRPLAARPKKRRKNMVDLGSGRINGGNIATARSPRLRDQGANPMRSMRKTTRSRNAAKKRKRKYA